MRLFLICLLLTGCAAFEPEPYNLQRQISTITVEVDPLLGVIPGRGDSGITGRALVAGDKCHITLREYPYCLAHEVRHCYEGAWHTKQPGTEKDCFQDGQQQNLP